MEGQVSTVLESMGGKESLDFDEFKALIVRTPAPRLVLTGPSPTPSTYGPQPHA